MKVEWSKLAEGIRNSYFPPEQIKELVKEVAASRLAICRACPYNSKVEGKRGPERCLKCGCDIKWKTHSLSAQCPDNPPRWTAMEGINHNQSNEIDTITGND